MFDPSTNSRTRSSTRQKYVLFLIDYDKLWCRFKDKNSSIIIKYIYYHFLFLIVRLYFTSFYITFIMISFEIKHSNLLHNKIAYPKHTNLNIFFRIFVWCQWIGSDHIILVFFCPDPNPTRLNSDQKILALTRPI
jgi:hypothetical protein